MDKRAFLLCILSMFLAARCLAMEEDFSDYFLPDVTLYMDGEKPLERSGLLQYPSIGVYAHPYKLAKPLLTIHSKEIIPLMPPAIVQNLIAQYHLAGNPEQIEKELFNKVATQELTIALIVVKGLATQPTLYNVVFHPIVADWLGKKPQKEDVQATIQAAIFNANGVQPAPSETIAFNAMGPLPINLHGIDNYSPNNGRFAIASDKGIETFWVMGALHNRATVAYVVLVTDPAAQKDVQESIANIAQMKTGRAQSEAVLSALERIAKELASNGKTHDSETLGQAVKFAKILSEKTVGPAEPKSESPKKSPHAPMPPLPPQKPAARKLSFVPAAEIDKELDDLYQELQILEHAISD